MAKYFLFPSIHLRKKREFYEQTIASGGEGVVLKHLNSPYASSEQRRTVSWVKCKKQVELDAYVSGFERGKPGSDYESKVACLVFSVQTEEGPLAIAKVSNLPWTFRKEVSNYDKSTGSVKLDVNCYGAVAHLVGLELSRKARRLVHPRIEYWRSDLKQVDCVYSFKAIEQTRKEGTNGLMLRIVASKPKND